MTITYTSPITQPSVTKKRLIRFGADPIERRIVCDFQSGYTQGGQFIGVGPVQRRVFTDESTPSFANFLAACPAAANLRRQAEEFEVTLDQPGTVD